MTTEITPRKSLSSDFWIGLLTPAFLAALVAFLAPIVILRAWVVTMLWGWYVVPAFGAEPLRIIYAFGAALLVNYLTHHHTEDDRSFVAKIGAGIYTALVVLLMGWVGTFFI